MDDTARKMRKIIDELISFFFRAGSNEVKSTLTRLENGYQLVLDSAYDPKRRDEIRELDRLFHLPKHNDGLEEAYWELTGVNTSGNDSELLLVGQMVDVAELNVQTDTVSVLLVKYYDSARAHDAHH